MKNKRKYLENRGGVNYISLSALRSIVLSCLLALFYYCVNSTEVHAQNCVHSGTILLITTNTTWNGIHFIDGDVVIQAGATLTITGDAYFKPNGFLKVNKSASLIVDGGLLSTRCDQLWQGVLVEGDNSQPQSPTSPLLPNPQGTATFINGSIVEHAVIGASSHDRVSNASAGGRIFVRNSTFRNNYSGLDFMPYPGSFGSYQSHVFNSDFYDDSNILPPPTINSEVRHIFMFGINGISILGSRMRSYNYTGSNAGGPRGIQSSLSSPNIAAYCDQPSPPVSPCPSQYWVYPEFENLFLALELEFSNINSTVIDQGIFKDNLQDILNYSNDNSRITRNKIERRGISITTSSKPYDGIYLWNSDGYWIEENELIASAVSSSRVSGVYIDDCGTEDNEVYKNIFKDFRGDMNNDNIYNAAASVSHRRNRNSSTIITGLQFLCNEYLENKLDIVAYPMDINMNDHFGIRAHQGDYMGGLPLQSTANTFTHTSSYIADIFNYANLFFYLHSGGNTEPLIAQQASTVILDLASSSRFCKSGFGSGSEEGFSKDGLDFLRFSSIEKDSLSAQFYENIAHYGHKLEELTALIDNGSTEALLLQISTTEVKNEIVSALSILSPYVSTDVIKALALNPVFEKGDIMTICLANPDATKNVFLMNFLMQVPNDPINEEDIAIITESWTEVTERTILMHEISNHSYLASTAVNKLINDLKLGEVSSENISALEEIYAAWPGMRYKYDYVEMLYEMERIEEATSLKNSLASNYFMNERDAHEFETYSQFYDFRLLVHTAGTNWGELNEEQIDELRNIAARYLSRGSYLASIMLCHYHGKCEKSQPYEYDEYTLPILLQKNQSHSTKNTVTKESINIYPNPSGHEVTIQMENPSNDAYRIEIYDLSGKVHHSQTGVYHNDLLSISKLDQGLYIVAFINEMTQNISFTKLIKQ